MKRKQKSKEQDVLVLTISGAELRSIPKNTAAMLATLSHAANEIFLFQKLLIISANTDPSSEIAKIYSNVHKSIIHRALISKLFEVVKLIRDYRKRSDRSSDRFGSSTCARFSAEWERLETLEAYKIVSDIRSHITNHYLLSKIEGHLDGLPDDVILRTVHHDQLGHSISELGEEVALMSILNRAGTPHETYRELQDWMMLALKAFSNFFQDFSIELHKEYLDKRNLRRIKYQIENRFVRSADKSSLPIILEVKKI